MLKVSLPSDDSLVLNARDILFVVDRGNADGLFSDLAPSVDLETDVSSDDLNSSVSDGDDLAGSQELSILVFKSDVDDASGVTANGVSDLEGSLGALDLELFSDLLNLYVQKTNSAMIFLANVRRGSLSHRHCSQCCQA
eukprot:TRINITY_DN293_c0_g1_i7.p2 TRINITY_DN293_c0_g1~~TRINITY_DN293_c0_g1_i7.p2  ORF type:complete len:139 (-),score=18.95 TRINITY_DN293_c0_g1_i7:168-584(-)